MLVRTRNSGENQSPGTARPVGEWPAVVGYEGKNRFVQTGGLASDEA